MMSVFAQISTGALLTIIRMLEPYFYFIVRKKFYELFGILIDDRETNELFNNTLNSYLTKSLNVELVNIIL